PRHEIATAQAKAHKTSVPLVPATEIAKNDKNDKSDKKTGPSLGSPVEDPRSAQQAKQLLADARVALKAGDLAKAENLTAQAEHLQGAYKSGEDSPAAVRREIDQV